jgi:hypothetical protein
VLQSLCKYCYKQVLRVAATSGGGANTSTAVRTGDASDEVTRLQRELRDAQARHQVYTTIQYCDQIGNMAFEYAMLAISKVLLLCISSCGRIHGG